jgi:hypothetical protein
MERIHYIIGIIIFLLFVASATGQVKDISQEDKIVACTILAEARGEGRGGMYAVGVVIAQRALNRKLSPSKVCLQNGLNKRGVRVWQFSCWNNPTNDKYEHLLEGDSMETIYARSLANIINLGYKQKRNYIDRKKYNYIDHYFNPKHASPSWYNKAAIKYRIGNHLFLRLKESPVK